MSWFLLMLAVLLDVGGTVCLKLSHGLSRFVPTVLMFILYGVGFAPLALAVRNLQVSIVYAVWSALGTALVVAIGIIWFKEPANALKMVSLGLIIVGLIFLNLSTQIG